MREPWWELLKQWWCEKFGHKLRGQAWYYKGCRHDNCVRCRRVVSVPLEKNLARLTCEHEEMVEALTDVAPHRLPERFRELS